MIYSAESLRTLLIELDISQAELAELSGIAQSTISRILDGTTSRPHQSTLRFLHQALTKHTCDVVDSAPAIVENSRVEKHLQFVSRWADSVTFRDLWVEKHLPESFVDLTLRAQRSDAHGKSVKWLCDAPGHFIINGEPGSGKTTSLKLIAYEAIRRYLLTSESPPLVVLFRHFSAESIFDTLEEILGIAETETSASRLIVPKSIRRSNLVDALNQTKALVLLDGFDELSPSVRNSVALEIQHLVYGARDYRVLLTCRSASNVHSFQNVQVVELQRLSQEQIKEFVYRWIGSARGNEMIRQLAASTFGDTAATPLGLAHLCAIYERAGGLPDQPRAVYRKISRLLLEDWDEQRGIHRLSRYAGFGLDQKEDFLCALAFELAVTGVTGVFSFAKFETAYLRINKQFGLPDKDAAVVMREVQSHTGIIVETGFELYRFAHRSLYEYLSAAHLVRLPVFTSSYIDVIPNECAVAVSMAAAPDSFLLHLLRPVMQRPVSPDRLSLVLDFLKRLVREKPEFRSSHELGWTIIGLVSYLKRMETLDGCDAESARTTLGQLGNLPHVRKSIRGVLAETSVLPLPSLSGFVQLPSALLEKAPEWLRAWPMTDETNNIFLHAALMERGDVRGF